MTIFEMEDDATNDVTMEDLNVSVASIYKINKLPQNNVPGF
jgi:hypothetical protein